MVDTTSLGGRSPVVQVSFLPSTHVLALATLAGTVQLWNTADPAHTTAVGALSIDPSDYDAIAASPDGHLLATSGANQTVLVWDVSDPEHPVLFEVLTDATHPAGFSPDGHTLAVIDANGSVRLRETDMRHAAAQVCAVTGTALDTTTWDQYFPGLAYQPPC
jgi:WD40 repeat protein